MLDKLPANVIALAKLQEQRLAEAVAKQATGTEGEKPLQQDLPEINAGLQNLKEVTEQAIQALVKANGQPWIFLHGGVPVRVERDPETKLLVTRELTPDRLRNVLARVARWYKERERKPGNVERYDAKPPMDVVRDVLATPNLPFPVLTRIVHAPVFAPDGEFQTTPGYHAGSKTYLALPEEFSLPEVPVVPTETDVHEAKRFILEELLGDFPFVADADRAHAVALLLLPFVRSMIDGPTPLHVIEASSPGSGKGLLADVLLMPALGRQVGVIPPPRDDDELRKGITGRLREGAAAILFDNVTFLGSPVLAAALTATVWDDRILGKSETIRLPVQCAWVATSNNATLTTEVARRSIRIRLDPKMDRPWLRTEFRHPELRTWAAEHRAELIWAAAVLVRSWLAAGRPKPSCRPLGSYESWTRVLGGILETAGIPGFLSNIEEFYEAADTEGAVWRQFVALWWERFEDKPVTTADLFPLAVEMDSFELGNGSDRAQKTAFGKRLAKQRDRVIGDYCITFAGINHHARTWRLLKVGEHGNIGEHSGPLAGAEKSPKPEFFGNGVYEMCERVGENVPLSSPCSPMFPSLVGEEVSGAGDDDESPF